MIKTVEEALQKYKQTLKYYFVCESRLKHKYGDNVSPRDYGQADYNDLQGSQARIEAAADVLGLSKEEREKIQKEVKASI